MNLALVKKTYKLNLLYKSFIWFGSKACKKKYLRNPEWLRSTKNKKYPFWRIDTLFSNTKYSDIHFVDNGGWHFSNIKNPKDLEKKLQNFLHHVDYEYSGMNIDDIKKLIEEKKVMYDHSLDKKDSKWGNGKKLFTVELNDIPKYISENLKKYEKWLD